MSRRYVYHAPDEPLPRETANGGYTTVHLGAIEAFGPHGGRACPAWGCDGPPYVYPIRGIVTMPPRSPSPLPSWWVPPGGMNLVAQPPPSAGGTLVVGAPGGLPISPQPSPTVGVSPAQTAPSLTQPGTTLDSSGASVTTAPADVMTWLQESTLFASFPNWAVVGVGALAAYMLLGGKQGRR